MNEASINQGIDRGETYQDASASLPALLKFLNLDRTDPWILDLSKSLKVDDFALGDEINNYNLASFPPSSVRNEPNADRFYLVCQGRVRLLGVDVREQREVSAMVVETGEIFGSDRLFCHIWLPYRAIAASPGQIACISSTQLSLWFDRLPALEDNLNKAAKQRQQQIFCKTSTDLRCLNSHQLRQLLPYFVECQIEANESLVKATPSTGGRYWLRSGEINSNLSPANSWGYPNTTPNAIAKTELLVYQLPIECWEVGMSIAPTYFKALVEEDVGNGNKASQTSVSKQQVNFSHIRRGEYNHREVKSASSNPSQSAISFPKPIKRRFSFQQYPFIGQQSATDCGAACLATIGQYWGKQFSINLVRELAGVGRSGASLKNLAAAAENLGFQAKPVRASLNRLIEQKNPWIAHWDGEHYVVVYRCKGKRILIADPAVGKRSLSHKEFGASWTGYALMLEPTERLASAETEKPSLNRFWGLVWPYRSIILQIILASVLMQVFGLIAPVFTQLILDEVVQHESLITLHVFALGLLLFGIWRIGLTASRQYLLDYFSNRLDLTLISGFISHALMLPLKFFESRHVGDIITRVQENQKIQMFLTRQAITAWLDALMAFVYLGLMAYYNWQLTLLVVALIPPIVILTLVATPFMRRVSRDVFNQAAAENSSLVEMFTGINTVKVAAAERDLRWRWEDRLTNLLNARFRGQKLANGLRATSELIHTLGSTALLWYGAKLTIEHQLTIGEFVAFNMLIGNVINPILALTHLWDELQEVVVSVERLNDVFLAKPEETTEKPLLTLPGIRGFVNFEKVTFRYHQDEERNALHNINFEVEPGQTIAIVGRSGSGKSTLVNLLQGLYHSEQGRILIDGHDLRHVSPHSLRNQLGVVPQECFLFSGTILENITFFDAEFTLEQVTEVAKLAEAHGFIQDLPLGYNTKVGERGCMLSGGQRQRLAIARALLGNPRILILDEATSSLDTESERRFQQNLVRLSRDRTTFIIAHRLSTVRNANSILVLDRGILVEQGTHDELMARSGIYYHLAQQQLDI